MGLETDFKQKVGIQNLARRFRMEATAGVETFIGMDRTVMRNWSLGEEACGVTQNKKGIGIGV